MSEKNFLSWIGFKNEEAAPVTPTGNSLERIRELESQLADLRSRKDITTLTKEEFEILATETATIIIKSAQAREAKAAALAQKVLADSSKSSKETITSADSKARQILSGAEARGRKYLETAETEANEKIASAQKEGEDFLNVKKHEALQVASSAKREADKLVSDALSEVSNYRGWLATAISESERLYRIQSQSLQAAEGAISQSRSRISNAFEKLAALQTDITTNLDSQDRPQSKVLIRAADVIAAELKEVQAVEKETAIPEVPIHKVSTPVTPRKGPVKKSVSSAATTNGKRRAATKSK
jgi:vacuolar-type H+-ATPase subunit H